MGLLEKIYLQSNFARRYQLEMEIQEAKQDEQSIQQFFFYNGNLGSTCIDGSSKTIFLCLQNEIYEEQRFVEFFVALRDYFEAITKWFYDTLQPKSSFSSS